MTTINHPEWLTPAEAALVAKRNATTIRRALESGELHGHQRVKGGRWQVHPDAVHAWIRGTNGAIACGCPQLRLAKRSA